MFKWLIGANGVFAGTAGGTWDRVGRFDFHVNCVLPYLGGRAAYVGVNCGLWDVDLENKTWRQLHDETLTEVLSVAGAEGEPAVVAASPYGIAGGYQDANGAVRWTSWSRNLRVNERYTSSVTTLYSHDYREIDDSGSLRPSGYLVGTEAGVLAAYRDGAGWERTSLLGVPVRAVIRALGRYWAGTDGNGIWVSSDGFRWNRAGSGFDDGTAFALAACGTRILAGTTRGVVLGDGAGAWERSGPAVLAAAVGVCSADQHTWLVGANPGGLWLTEDSGRTWRQDGTFVNVRAISALGEREE